MDVLSRSRTKKHLHVLFLKLTKIPSTILEILQDSQLITLDAVSLKTRMATAS